MPLTRATLCGIFTLAGVSLAGPSLSGCDRKGDKASCDAALTALDADGDGFIASDASLPKDCDGTLEDALATAGLGAGDCADESADIYPGAGELCGDDIDQDCDGSDAVLLFWYSDVDGDGYGDPLTGQEVCKGPTGAVDNGDDCDDADAEVNPGAVETICGDRDYTRDLNCDDFTACAVAGDLDADGWAALGVSLELAAGAGRSMDADERPGGAVLVGGEDGAWTVRYASGALEGEEITVADGVDAGDSVCWFGDADEDGALDLALGDPGYSSERGRISLAYSGGDSGSLLGVSSGDYVGSSMACADGLIAATRSVEYLWRVYFLRPGDLPTEGASPGLSATDIADVAVKSIDGTDSADTPLDVYAISTSWLVALGQPEADSGGVRVVVYVITESEVASLCTINDSSDTLGASVLIADLDGDDLPDLIAGDPGAQTAYVWSDILACAGATISSRNADYNAFTGVARLGETLARVPDMNGDGIDDVLVGGVNGAALVLGFDGSMGPPSAITPYATLKGTGGFGASLGSTDLNEDGYADLLFGAPSTGQIVALWGGP